MDVVIVGGHGKIGRLLARELQTRGDRPRAVIRNPAHEADVREAGADPVLCDLEQQGPGAFAEAIGSADALVFTAGAGPGSGAARKWTVDFAGAVVAAAACRANGIDRYVLVSSIGADDPPPFDPGDVFNVYLHAKAAADKAVLATGLAATIVRPGSLTDDPPTGRVHLAPKTGRGAVSRADVAAVLAEVLHRPATAGLQFGVIGGDTPVADAVAALT
jgi:nucleoside-diphosphate-sugar epimerase